MGKKGFTLLEILMTVAIGAVILSSALLSYFTIISNTTSSKSRNIVLTDVNTAALQIRKDIQMIQSTDLQEGVSQNTADLSWTDLTATDNTTHSVNYQLSGTKLLRDYDNDTITVVGRHITYLSFTKYGRVVEVVITATSDTAPPLSETLKLNVYTRSDPN